MGLLRERVKVNLFQIYYEQIVNPIDFLVFIFKFKILKIHNRSKRTTRSKKYLKEQIRKEYDIAGLEWYRLELFKSIESVPDEMLPYLGNQVYKCA